MVVIQGEHKESAIYFFKSLFVLATVLKLISHHCPPISWESCEVGDRVCGRRVRIGQNRQQLRVEYQWWSWEACT